MTGEFVMYGARASMAAGLSHIEVQVKGIERAVVENPGLAFDLAKTLVESACRTILTERKIAFVSDDELAKLFKMVTSNLPLLPVAASGEADARRSLAQTLSGLHSALQGVSELRNAYGFASHGSDSPRPVMETVQAVLAATAADAIVGFLYRVHRQEPARLPGAQLLFDDNHALNAYIDEANEVVKIFELEYPPSEVLFRVDREAYLDVLSSFTADEADNEPAPPE
jgi:hypothetical protein